MKNNKINFLLFINFYNRRKNINDNFFVVFILVIKIN